MPVKDGAHCPGCGLPNYEGLCPHCRGDQDAYEDELVPPFETSIGGDERCLCHVTDPDSFGNRDHIVNPDCPFCGEGTGTKQEQPRG